MATINASSSIRSLVFTRVVGSSLSEELDGSNLFSVIRAPRCSLIGNSLFAHWLDKHCSQLTSRGERGRACRPDGPRQGVPRARPSLAGSGAKPPTRFCDRGHYFENG